MKKNIKECSVDGCLNMEQARGYCPKHYQRWRLFGNPLLGKRITPEVCTIDGCSGQHLARGYCSKHYNRWRVHGDPNVDIGDPTAAKKFLFSVALSYGGEDCLIWPFARNANGYAVFGNPGGTKLVSRFICESVRGVPPSSAHEARHLCGKGNEGCCSPRHLLWGTPSENQKDRLVHGTDNRGEKHPLSRLTVGQVIEIRAARGKHSQTNLAKQFGVSRSNISHIQNGTTWGWL